MARPMQPTGSRISQGGHRGETDADGFHDRTRSHLAPGRRGRTVFLEPVLRFARPRRCWFRSRSVLCGGGSVVRFLLRRSLLGLRLLRAVPACMFARVRPRSPSPQLFRRFREPLPSPPLAIVLLAVRLLQLPEPHPFLAELRARFRLRIFVPVLRIPLLHAGLFRERVPDVRLRLPSLRKLRLWVRIRV